jgi:hypothetical protein
MVAGWPKRTPSDENFGRMAGWLSDMVAGWPKRTQSGETFGRMAGRLSDMVADGRRGHRRTKLSGGWPGGRLSVRHHGAVSSDHIGGRMAGGRLSIRHHAVEALGDIFGQTIWRDNQAFLQWDIGFGRHYWTDDLLPAAGGASRCGEELALDDSSRETHCAGSGVRGEEK